MKNFYYQKNFYISHAQIFAFSLFFFVKILISLQSLFCSLCLLSWTYLTNESLDNFIYVKEISVKKLKLKRLVNLKKRFHEKQFKILLI